MGGMGGERDNITITWDIFPKCVCARSQLLSPPHPTQMPKAYQDLR